MFEDGKSLWKSLAAVRLTSVSSTLPALSVLLQGRNLRGSLPFLPEELSPKFVPSTFVRKELAARQSQTAFSQPHSPSTRTSTLLVGQRVRAFVKSRWLHGVIHSVWPEPQSCIVRLDDGRLFRRTRWAINIDHGHVSFPMWLAQPASCPVMSSCSLSFHSYPIMSWIILLLLLMCVKEARCCSVWCT